MSKLYTINNTFESYQSIITLYHENSNKIFSEVPVELHGFFSANMSAALGAVLDVLSGNFNTIKFEYIRGDVESILSKNDFLTFYGRKRAVDIYGTTIKFQKLKPTDGKFFKSYVIEELLNTHVADLPRMSAGVKEKIVEAIYEIFVNAQIHSETTHIYTCGQFFPNKNKIEFTIVDTGIGFKQKVNSRFGWNLSSAEAIDWAVQDRKTTKIGIPGGIGLAVMSEFIKNNKGKFQIISDDGFYQFDENGVTLKQFEDRFPGTIVNLQFKTDDPYNYSLKSEININDIF
jgi:hypothetical protein